MPASPPRPALHRRASDQVQGGERRSRADRRIEPGKPRHLRYPSWQEQVIQFLTRYLFVSLGILFFNFTDGTAPAWLSLQQLNVAFGLYVCINTILFWHARSAPISVVRYRTAMWIDILITSISVLNDPYPIPPSLLVFIMVVLGNGMRYGMGVFREALVGCFAAAMFVLSLRFAHDAKALSPGLLFLNLFGGIILVYAYILMGRIEKSRVQLEHRSRIDTLTGLMNRPGLIEAADHLFARVRQGKGRLAVMFADLDKFKSINDTYGHAVGDNVLKRFARVLTDALRHDDVAARMGGDEFVLILLDTDLRQAEKVANRIQRQVAECVREHRLSYSVTIGIGEAPIHGDTLSALLDRVDGALYRAKAAAGGGGVLPVSASLET